MADFRVLGPVEVAAAGRVAAIRSAKARTLLALLLVRANIPVPIGTLSDELWDGAPPGQATAALRVHVSYLRKALQSVDAADLLVTRPGGYVLVVSPDKVDAQRFAHLTERGHAQLASGQPLAAIATLKEAEALWRGEAFADVAALPTVDAECTRLHEQRLGVVEARIDAELACGRHSQVIVEVERLTVQHPLRERLWEQRMLALYRCGRQADALAAYTTLRAVLDDNLGISPGPALSRLHTAVLRQDPGLELDESRLERSPAATVRPTPDLQGRGFLPGPLRALASAPLVGQEGERRLLRRLWSAGSGGSARLVVVQGPAGSGKTRLCADLAAHAAQHGATVLYGCGHEGIPPELSRRLDAEHSLAAANQAIAEPPAPNEEHGAPLLCLPSSTPASQPGILDRGYEIAEMIGALLRAKAQKDPVLVVLDDLQWADRPSLQLLHALARRRSDLGAAVVLLVWRPPEAQDSPLIGLLADLARTAVTDRVDVGALDRAAVAALCRSAGLPAEGLAATVHEAAAGNAFFVGEMLRHLQEQGLPSQRPLVVPVPRGVTEVVAARLAALASPSRRLLLTAAVVGIEFGVELLTAATGLDADTVLDSLEDLLRRGLVRPVASDPHRYRFDPPLLRTAVYDQLSHARRSHMDRLVAEAIQHLSRPRIEHNLAEFT